VENPQALRLTPGQRIGAYRIDKLLGEGGMGQVWQAHDLTIRRDVAIKVIAARFAGDADRLRRFEQEAQAAGQIAHPNILTIYAVGHEAGVPYLVTELLEGETLASRLRTSPLPPDRALDYAIQIVDGLAAAHDGGIIHRDLKPDNLFVTTDERVKILDFGVAKLTAPATGDDDPTRVETAAGEIVGTAGYMSPEQVRGQPVDHRTDVFAFGTVLYEMLAGRRAFTGDSRVETLNAILVSNPPPLDAPPALARVVKHALEKAPELRFQSARDLAFHLRAISDPAAAVTATAALAGGQRGRRAVWIGMLIWAVAVTAVGAGLAISLARARPAPFESTPRRFAISLAETPLYALERPPLVISADGRRLAYVAGNEAGSRIFVRDLNELAARPIPGTENGFGPFFSPDGEHLAFFVADGLMRLDVGGGPPTRLAITPPVSRGGVWSADGWIYFAPSPSTGIVRIRADGGTIEPVTKADAAQGHVWPDVSPDGSVLVYVERHGESFADARIVVRSIKTGERRVLAEAGTFPRFASQSRILFVRGATMFAVQVDSTSLASVGDPRPVLDGVQMDPLFGFSAYSASRDGTIVYIPGDARPVGRTLLWVSAAGEETKAFPEERPFLYPAISPDGKSIAVTVEGMHQDLWSFDVGQPVLTRLTSASGEDFGPVWSPDGRRLAFTSIREGKPPSVFVKPAGTPNHETRVTDAGVVFPNAWTTDGLALLVTQEAESNRQHMSQLMTTTADRADLKPVAASSFERYGGTLSPEGRRLAFVSLETGRAEVFVATWPGATDARQASVGGGGSPVWSRNGRTLFYRNGDGTHAVDVGAAPALSRSVPRLLFRGRFEEPSRPDWPRNYDVAPDGRFLMIRQTYTPVLREIVVMLNWR
jgi:Tol biopolymer transport system component